MRAAGIALTLLTFWTGAACAGAWPRPEGSGFVSLAYEATTPRAALLPEALALDPVPEIFGYQSIFAEYGLTDRITLGLDAGGEENPDTWSGVAFVRIPLDKGAGRHRWAAQLGVGQRRYLADGPFPGQEFDTTELIVRPLLAWGTGFDNRLGTGWLGAETSIEWRQDTAGHPVKLDLTAGLNLNDKTFAMIQLQTGDFPQANPYAKLVPTVVRRIRPWVAVETGLILGLHGDDSIGGRLAVWFDF